MTTNPDPLAQTKQHLDLLSIGYFIAGGLALLFSLFFLIYVVLGGFMMASPESFQPDEPPAAIGCFMMAFGGVFLLLGWAYGICMILAGRNLKRRAKHTFCIVMAAISCIFAPVGTVIGVLSLIVLTKLEVKALFEGGSANALEPATGTDDSL